MHKFVILSALLILSGCGFQPLHGQVFDKDGVALIEEFKSISIGNIPNREGQILRNLLIDRFYRDGRATDVVYRLQLSPLVEVKRDLDITVESDSTREELRIDTNMQLIDVKTGQTLVSRKLFTTTSFNVLENEFAKRVSEQNSRKNALNDLARQIELHVALYFKRH